MMKFCKRTVVAAVVAAVAAMSSVAPVQAAESDLPPISPELKAQLQAGLSGTDAGFLQLVTSLAAANPNFAAAIAAHAAFARKALGPSIATSVTNVAPNAAPQIAGGVATAVENPAVALEVFNAVINNPNTPPSLVNQVGQSVGNAVPQIQSNVNTTLAALNTQPAAGGGNQGGGTPQADTGGPGTGNPGNSGTQDLATSTP